MVTTGITMLGQMPSANGQIVQQDGGQFMQTLETELTAGGVISGETAVLVPSDLSPELKAQLSNILANFVAQAEQQEEDGGLKLLELIIKLLGKDGDKEEKDEILADAVTDRDEADEAQTVELLMELAAALYQRTSTEPVKTQTAEQVFIAPVVESEVKLEHTDSAYEAPADRDALFVHSAEKQSNPFVLTIDAETAELAQPVAAQETPVVTQATPDAMGENPVEAKTQPEAQPVRNADTAQPVAGETSENSLEQLARKTVDTLEKMLSEATGQKVLIHQEAERTVQPQTAFYKPQTPVKTQETDEELTQLMANLSKNRTETETAVKLPDELLQNVYTAQTAQPQPQIAETEELPVAAQVRQAIIANLKQEDGETIFTMKLTPRELGEVDVKIVSAEGKISVEITAHSERTAEILNQRLDNIQTALKENNVELEKYQVVYNSEETAADRRDYNGSSKNPYGRRQQQKQDENAPDFSELLDDMAV